MLNIIDHILQASREKVSVGIQLLSRMIYALLLFNFVFYHLGAGTGDGM